MIVPSRRGFLGGLGALIVAPSIVRADSLMRMGMHERIRRYVPMLVGQGPDLVRWSDMRVVEHGTTECWMWDRFEDRVAWIRQVPNDSRELAEWRATRGARTYDSESWWQSTGGALWRSNTPEFQKSLLLPDARLPHKHPTGADWPWNASA